ncbi:hypothetical protein RIF29_08751 [Crotalaria pallida]|uniref:Uncharacterized protein n=1 Tax=Crotalaria pallida TaxID=3830 RepID=A0AAN9FTZ7_CROPI
MQVLALTCISMAAKIDETQAPMPIDLQLYATWDPHQEAEIEKLFHKRMSSRLRGILCEACAAGRRPNWLQPDVWNYLCQHWQTDHYKHLQEVGKANRASEKGRSLHTGGRKTALDHAKTMIQSIVNSHNILAYYLNS